MRYEEFIAHIKENMSACFGREKKIRINKVIKNNDKELDALVIISEENPVTPTVYLNDYYTDYLEGRDIEDIVEEIFHIYESHYMTLDFDVNKFMNYNEVKDRIAYKVVNREKNKKYLKDVPFIPFLDLAIVFYYMLDNSNEGNAIAVIHNSHIDLWKIDKETLYKKALENTPKLLPYSLQSMEDVIHELIRTGEYPYCVEEDDSPVMYVLTNNKKFYGASAILYEDVLKNFAESLKMDIFVLPSSVHEVILVPDMGGVNKEELTMMVKDVNSKEVSESDILSDHAYIYRYEEGVLCE